MLDRLTAPPARPVTDITLPTAEVAELPNGARLHVLTNTAQPVIRLQLIFPAGRWYDPVPGVSLLAARGLLEGTHTRTAKQIADEIAYYGASLECEQGFDRSILTLYCLSRYFEQLLPLVEDIILNAAFPAPELQLLQNRIIQNVQVERQKTSYLATERYSHNLYGPANPYGRTFDEESFRSIQPETVRAFHQSNYVLSAAEIFLCGDVSASQQNSAAAILGAPESVLPTLTPSATHSIPGADYVQVPGSLQASLRLGRFWPDANHPDNHQLQILTRVLGGYFGSRLMKNIREDKGYTYGIYASVSHREQASSLVIGSDVNATNASAAVNEIQHELRRLQEEAIPEDELLTVCSYITGKFLNELGTVFEQCDKYRSIVMLKLPQDYYAKYLQTVNSTDSSSLQTLAQQYLSPEDFIEVIAGPEQ